MTQLNQPAGNQINSVRLIPFGHASDWLYEAAMIYAAVWGRNTSDSLLFFRHHADYSDYRGVIALLGTVPVGFAFGTRSESGQWWHDKVCERVGSQHPALQNAWVLTELGVLDGYRNRHIGGMLHDRMLQLQPASNVLLSTQVDNDGARRFYERRGWQYLHHGFQFQPGRPAYVIMHHTVTHITGE